MPGGDIVIVFDCGATNARVIATGPGGEILASGSLPNNTRPDPFYPEYKIWDVREIWDKLTGLSKQVVAAIDPSRIAGVTVTTFGVDGTMFDRNGTMLYPVISWQCERTGEIMSGIGKYMPLEDLYRENGVFPFSFNTINKLIWFCSHKPELVEKCHRFLFMPSIFTYFLTGEMANDTSMAGTSMLTSLSARGFSGNILGRINFPADKFGQLVEPGTITGTVNREASRSTSIPEGTPVISTGHDTQFAIFGSGAGKNQPVLSSGTWEILMVRAESYRSGKEQLETGITTELDSRPGLYNIGNQWIASGIVEWVRKNFYGDVAANVYDVMISGAADVPAGSNGVTVVPDFYEAGGGKAGGTILGLTMETTRDEIFHALLEGLSGRLSKGKQALENAGGFKSESIICVGGGSRNTLWNQLKADYTGVPLKVIDQKETTVLGASLFVQAAVGNATSPEDARERVKYNVTVFEPGGRSAV